jgi:hypothetical protein
MRARYYKSVMAVLPLGVLLAGCPPSYAVWVLPSGTPTVPEFHFASKRGGADTQALTEIRVMTCGGIEPDLRWIRPRTVWRVAARDASDSLRQLSRLRSDSGSGGASFWVDSTGEIRAWSGRDNDSAAAVWKRHDRAYRATRDTVRTRCQQAYAEARTSADSEAVHRTVLWDTSRFVSIPCRGMRPSRK